MSTVVPLVSKSSGNSPEALPLVGDKNIGNTEWYRLDTAAVCRELSVDPTQGLTQEEATRRLAIHGPNDLGGDEPPSALKVAFRSLVNPMNAVLFIALLIAAIAQDITKSIVLAVIILTNSYLGFRQEYKAERTMDALRKLASPTAAVIRSGHLTVIPAAEVVPGDILQLDEGAHVAADVRVLEAVNLSCNEALLTGEPMAIRKHSNALTEVCPLGDQKNMAFKSTTVAYGRGRAICVATGMKTEIGKIATDVVEGSNSTGKTPLEKSMEWFMLGCLIVAILLGIVVFWVNRWNFGDRAVLLYAIATAVAILPEGLPAVTTVCLALGVARMAKQKAIVRKLVSLEALGQVQHICSDKTGTLTEGKMSVVSGWVLGQEITVTGSYNKDGSITGVAMDKLKSVLQLCGLCNTCTVKLEAGHYVGQGDTTEIALAVLADRHGYSKTELVGKTHTFFAEYPFDSSIKRMSVVYRDADGHALTMFTKGAVESVLSRCSSYADANGEIQPMHGEFQDVTVHSRVEAMATQGLRVLALAMRRIEAAEATSELLVDLQEAEKRDVNERNLVFLGLLGIADPPRKETRGAIEDCHGAGIIVHMITGDHPATAAAIARQINILPEHATPGSALAKQLVMTSMQFDPMTDAQIDALPHLPLVIARCSPETKVKMVKALHRRNKFVAMTGDGVNDAPAIAYSDVGIAMGEGGADVTKQAADLVLTDDNFATISRAIAQGRRVFANIVKFTTHLLSGNVSEVVALIIGLAFADGLGQPVFPMSAIQILWLNLVTSSPIALALAAEPASPKLMKMAPRTHGVYTWEVVADTSILGIVAGALTLATFILVAYVAPAVPLNKVIPPAGLTCNKVLSDACEPAFRARGVAFITLSVILLFHGINCRFDRRSMFYYTWSEAKILIWGIVGGLVLLAPLPYIPVINTTVFLMSPFDYEWGYVVASTIIFMTVAEVYKFVKRRILPKKNATLTAAQIGAVSYSALPTGEPAAPTRALGHA